MLNIIFFFMKYKIGVMGSAQGPAMAQQSNTQKAILLGREIAKKNAILVNGACPGLPNDAAMGAKMENGFVLGISPAYSLREHVHKYKSPIDSYDLILYTGLGLMERDIINIRSSDAVVIIGGGIGTLNEFTVAFDEGKHVGVLEGTDGISDHLKHIVKLCHRDIGQKVIFDTDPKKLIDRLVQKLNTGAHPMVEDERIVGIPMV